MMNRLIKVNAIQTTAASNIVKKPDYNTTIDKTENKTPEHDKFITTQEFNELTEENFATRLKQKQAK